MNGCLGCSAGLKGGHWGYRDGRLQCVISGSVYCFRDICVNILGNILSLSTHLCYVCTVSMEEALTTGNMM